MNKPCVISFRTVLLPVLGCVLVFSCQQQEATENVSSTESLVNTSVFPIQPLQVIAPANLRLSFIGRTPTDSSVFYQVQSTYNGAMVGFDLSVPKGEEGTAYISSKGSISDAFLRQWQGLYGQAVDTTAHFADHAPATWASLGAMVFDDSVARSKDTTHQKMGTQSKLVFTGGKLGMPVELYLDINEKDHWVELEEKDTAFRARVIRALTK